MSLLGCGFRWRYSVTVDELRGGYILSGGFAAAYERRKLFYLSRIYIFGNIRQVATPRLNNY